MTPEPNLKNQICRLLEKSGIKGEVTAIELSDKGGNNRLYRVTTTTGIYAVKQYFTGAADQRDRLGSEFNFLTYAREVVSNVVPKAYSHDRDAGLAVYEFISGRSFEPGSIGEKEIRDAADFFVALNQSGFRSSRLAKELPYSEEACFSILNHLDLVSGRLSRLKGMPQTCSEDRVAHEFLKRLLAFWDDLVNSIRTGNSSEELNRALLPNSRCISPSDFGFHNALAGQDGKTYFIDFEYAGWDDPSRMVADFFSQPAVPVPDIYFKEFADRALAVFPEPKTLVEKASLLLPVYRVKWCCIILNVFLPKLLERKLFANPFLKEQELKQKQLSKAETILKSIQKGTDNGIHRFHVGTS